MIDDIATNPDSEGFAIRSKDGTRIPLVMLMFLEEKTQERLAILAKDRTATFRARGYAGTDRWNR